MAAIIYSNPYGNGWQLQCVRIVRYRSITGLFTNTFTKVLDVYSSENGNGEEGEEVDVIQRSEILPKV